MFGQKGENLHHHPCIEGQIERYKKSELIFKVEKFDFNLEQAEIISENYPKITTHFANHLKDDTMVDESIEWIEKF
jgi:hypothetical protein